MTTIEVDANEWALLRSLEAMARARKKYTLANAEDLPVLRELDAIRARRAAETYRCPAVEVAKVWRHHGHPMSATAVAEMTDLRLQCELAYGHGGHHKTTMPPEAGKDAGKTWVWPNDFAWRAAECTCGPSPIRRVVARCPQHGRKDGR